MHRTRDIGNTVVIWIPNVVFAWIAVIQNTFELSLRCSKVILVWLQKISHNYRPLMKLREGNVFSHVCLSMGEGGGGVPCNNHPWWIGPHCAGTPSHWRPVQTCSLHDPLIPHWCWHLVAFETHMVSTSRWYTSNWSTFLFSLSGSTRLKGSTKYRLQIAFSWRQ